MRGIRRRVFLVVFGLVAVATAASLLVLEVRLRERLESDVEAALLRQARAGRVLLESAPQDGTARTVDPLAVKLGAATGHRVTVIAADGRVLGDSELAGERLRAVENHANRPEVIGALAQGQGSARRYSSTLDTEMLYVAVAFEANGHTGVVRVATPLSQVDRAIGALRLSLLLAGLATLAIGLSAAMLAAQLVTRSLRDLTERARALASGQNPQLGAARELAGASGLAGTLNRLASELSSTVAQLAAERDRLQAVIEGTDAAVIAIDAAQEIQLVNRAARALFALPEQVEGRRLVEVARQPSLLEAVERGVHGEALTVELEVMAPVRRQVAVRVTPSPLETGVVLVFHDVTRLRALETVRRDFVANVSHELRTPVSVIRANAETLVDGAIDEDPEQARVFAAAILRHADRLARLVADLLDISRIESGSFVPERVPVGVAAVFASAAEALGARARDKAIGLRLEAAPELAVLADVEALTQVVQNLVENAVVYTQDGGNITLAATRRDGLVRLTVEDDGPGIEPRHRGRIFERFYRADAGRSRAQGSTGLGLSIVKHLVQAMRGTVGFEPVSPRGARFWVELDAAELPGR